MVHEYAVIQGEFLDARDKSIAGLTPIQTTIATIDDTMQNLRSWPPPLNASEAYTTLVTFWGDIPPDQLLFPLKMADS